MSDVESYVEEVRFMFVRRFHDDRRTIEVASRSAVLAGFGLPAEPQMGGLIPATLDSANQSILAGLLLGYFGKTGEAAVGACFGVLWPTVAVPVVEAAKPPVKRKPK